MSKWLVEGRKHAAFAAGTLVLLCAALVVHLCIHTSVAGIVWVFAVMLLSSAWAVYACAQVFAYVARGADMLLQLSTQSPLKKMLLKTAPLVAGFAVVGMATVGGYLWAARADAHLTTAQVLGVLGAKLLSVAGTVAWGWFLARCVRRVRSFGLQLTLYGLLWLTTIVIIVCALIAATHTSLDSWFIGVSDSFVGLPDYAVAIPVIFAPHPGAATALTMGVNAALISIAVVAEALRYRHTTY